MDANPGTGLKSAAAFAAAIGALRGKKKSRTFTTTPPPPARTHTHPGSKGDSSSSPGLAAGFRLAPDTLLTPVGPGLPSPALPPTPPPRSGSAPVGWGGPSPHPGRPRAPGREAAGGRSPPGTCSRPGPSRRGFHDPRGRPGPSSALEAFPALGRVPAPPPPRGSPAQPRTPSGPAPGELTTCSSPWELAHREGFSPLLRAGPAPCGAPGSGGRGWRRGAGGGRDGS